MIELFSLVRAGYGSLNEVRKLNSREVIQALHYESFIDDFEDAYVKKLESERSEE